MYARLHGDLARLNVADLDVLGAGTRYWTRGDAGDQHEVRRTRPGAGRAGGRLARRIRRAPVAGLHRRRVGGRQDTAARRARAPRARSRRPRARRRLRRAGRGRAALRPARRARCARSPGTTIRPSRSLPPAARSAARPPPSRPRATRGRRARATAGRPAPRSSRRCSRCSSASAQERPLLLAIEDVHWADRSTRAFLAFLARSLCDERVLVVAHLPLRRAAPPAPAAPAARRARARARARRIELARFDRAELADAARPTSSARRPRTSSSTGCSRAARATRSSPRSSWPPASTAAAACRRRCATRSWCASSDCRRHAQEVLRLLAAGRGFDHQLARALSGLEPRELREVAARGRRRATSRSSTTRAGTRSAMRCCARSSSTTCCPASARRCTSRWRGRLRAPVRRGPRGARVAAAHRPPLPARPATSPPRSRRPCARRARRRVRAHGEAAALLERALELWDRVPDADGARRRRPRIDLLTARRARHSVAGDRARAVRAQGARSTRSTRRRPAPRASAARTASRTMRWTARPRRGRPATSRTSLELLPEDERRPSARSCARRPGPRFAMLQGRYGETAARRPRRRWPRAAAGGDDSDEHGAQHARRRAHGRRRHERGAGYVRDAIDARPRRRPAATRPSRYVNLADGLHLVGRSRGGARGRARGPRAPVDGLATPSSGSGAGDRRVRLRGRRLDDLGRGACPRRAATWPASASTSTMRARSTRWPAATTSRRRPRSRSSTRARGDERAAVPRRRSARSWPSCTAAAATSTRPREVDRRRARPDRVLHGGRLARRAGRGRRAPTVEADRAERARDLGDADVAARALERADALLARVAAAADARRPVEDGACTPPPPPTRRARRAATTRPRGPPRRAAWEAVGRPYRAAQARAARGGGARRRRRPRGGDRRRVRRPGDRAPPGPRRGSRRRSRASPRGPACAWTPRRTSSRRRSPTAATRSRSA